jgi:drug/metabolite transporter (DMT)-like permease
VSPRAWGVAQILLSGFCFGFLGIFGKAVYERGGTPGELLSLRFIFSSIILWTIFLARSPERLRLSGRTIFHCAILGAFGYAVFSNFYFLALQGLSVSLTVLLLYMYPVIVAAGAWALFGEKIPRERWLAIPVAIGGLVLLVWGDFEVSRLTGLLFGIGSAVMYSAYILASSRWLKGIDPGVSGTYIQTAAALGLTAVYIRDVEATAGLVARAWPYLLGLAVVCSLLAIVLFQAGMQKLKSWEVSILSLAEPVTSIALAILLLGETLKSWQIVGAVSVLVALAFVAMPVRARAS